MLILNRSSRQLLKFASCIESHIHVNRFVVILGKMWYYFSFVEQVRSWQIVLGCEFRSSGFCVWCRWFFCTSSCLPLFIYLKKQYSSGGLNWWLFFMVSHWGKQHVLFHSFSLCICEQKQFAPRQKNNKVPKLIVKKCSCNVYLFIWVKGEQWVEGVSIIAIVMLCSVMAHSLWPHGL